MKRRNRIIVKNEAGPQAGGWFAVKNEAGTPVAEVMIYDKIGKDWMSDDGIAAKDFAEALKGIPSDREIHCRINSIGGNVWDGMAIYSMLKARRDKVTCYVDGVAASIASVIACAGKRTVMPKNALMMTHPPSALCMGDSDQMRDCADKLDVHARAIASVYAEKTGKSADYWMGKLQSETWMSGADAMREKLADEVTEEVTVTAQMKGFDFSQFRCVPDWLRGEPKNSAANSGENTKETKMNRKEILALLTQHGIQVANDATDEQVMAALNQLGARKPAPNAAPQDAAVVNALKEQVDNITSQLKAERERRITADVNALVGEGRVTAAEAPKAIVRAVADETYLAELRVRPQVLPGSAPLNAGVEVVSEDVRNVIAGMQKHIVIGPQSFDTAPVRSAALRGIWTREREKLAAVLNAGTNTISADLKRVLILNETIRAFATRLLVLRQFATVFGNVPLQGTDEVIVPYFPLRTDASTDFVAANGYVFAGTTNSSGKKITVNKRKYQPLDYSSETFRRQPYFDVVKLGAMNAERLGVDVLKDILSVVTTANFGAAVLTVASNAIDSDDIATLRGIANAAMWPDTGRSLILDSLAEETLHKDAAYKLALNIGGTEVIRGGKLPNLSGFEVAWMPGLPTNAQNLNGFIAFASAILTAFAPVDPAAGVRNQLVAYEIVTDAATGISFNYRHWGDPQMDVDHEIIECAYGFAPGEAAAIKRIVSA